MAIHRTGNALLNEPLLLSEQVLDVSDDTLQALLLDYFLGPFTRLHELFRFTHTSGNLGLNAVYHFVQAIFKDPEDLYAQSVQLAKHLQEVSNHPKIKSGELYVVYLKNMQVDGMITDAVGIFKSEHKEPFLKVQRDRKDFVITYEAEAINIQKLDKGCVVFNLEEEEGYRVAVIDQTNKQEAAYWVDDFLKLQVRNDDYNQTQNVLHVYKDFVTQKMDEVFELTKADKIDMLNRSMDYFKKNDSFDFHTFSSQVIGDEDGIKMFRDYKANYESENDMPIGDSFTISGAAVKKQSRVYKSVLKLDKNFHIYIHGDKELIEKGFDEEKNLNYYKVYFREEQ